MFLTEKKIVDYIISKKDFLFLLIMSILALVVRVSGFEVMSTDLVSFLIPWISHYRNNGGINALSVQVGDYNILYQTILAFVSYLPYREIILVKWISVIFDYCIAVICAIISKKWISDKSYIFVYAAILFWPTVIINSAYWGQCDSLYVFILILSLYFLFERKNLWAFVLLGVSFGLKLQTIFVLPVFIILYIINKRFSIYNFIITLISFWLTGIVGFIKGRNIFDIFNIYSDQTDTYKYLTMNATGFWSLWHGNNYNDMKSFGIWLTIAILGFILYYFLNCNTQINTPEQFIGITLIVVWSCLVFLPAIHERYDYLLTILLILLICINKKYVIPLFIVAVVDIYNYGNYFIYSREQTIFLSILFLVAYVYSFFLVIKAKYTINA